MHAIRPLGGGVHIRHAFLELTAGPDVPLIPSHTQSIRLRTSHRHWETSVPRTVSTPPFAERMGSPVPSDNNRIKLLT